MIVVIGNRQLQQLFPQPLPQFGDDLLSKPVQQINRYPARDGGSDEAGDQHGDLGRFNAVGRKTVDKPFRKQRNHEADQSRNDAKQHRHGKHPNGRFGFTDQTDERFPVSLLITFFHRTISPIRVFSFYDPNPIIHIFPDEVIFRGACRIPGFQAKAKRRGPFSAPSFQDTNKLLTFKSMESQKDWMSFLSGPCMPPVPCS